MKRRKAIIRHLKEGNIELLKSYFGIKNEGILPD